MTLCFVLWFVALVVLVLVLPLGLYSGKGHPYKSWWGTSVISTSCCGICTPDDDDFVEAVCGSLSQCNEIADIKDRLDILEAAAAP